MGGLTTGRAVDKRTLEQVIAELREINRRTGIDRTLAVGELVLTRFFDGRPELFRDRRKNKGNSIRRLAESEACPFSKSALNEAVGVYIAVTETPCVRTFGQITASHVASVLQFPPAERERLLGLADRERMSVRDLRAKVVELRRAGGERRGRPCTTQQARLVTALDGATRRMAAQVAELEALGDLPPDVRQRLAQLADALSRLEARVSALGGARARNEPSRPVGLPSIGARA